MTQRARIEERRAALREQFGLEQLIRHFGEPGAEIVLASFGKFARGKYKGEQRGFIHWKKCVEGGWSYEGDRGHVQYPGVFGWAVGRGFDRKGVLGERDSFGPMTDAEWIVLLQDAVPKLPKPKF